MTAKRLAAAARSHKPAVVLVVAMGLSVHTQRWLKAARHQDMRFVLVPVEHMIPITAEGLTPVRHAADIARLGADDIGLWSPEHFVPSSVEGLPPPLEYESRSPLISGTAVAMAVRWIKPDLVHSLELQHAGYTCLDTAREMGAQFPPWLVSNWGSDLYLYAKLGRHRPVLAELMSRADAYISECVRDIAIARQMGFRGTVLPPLPASGGMQYDELSGGPAPSLREEIVIKGYHGWSGRGMHILSALHLAAPELRRFRIWLRHASPAVSAMAEALQREDGLAIEALPYQASHQESLGQLARARLSVSLGISGGIDTTMLESMSLGVFPITTCATCAGEWLENGRDGMLVDPHDVAGLAKAITRAATDDDLVDKASARNQDTVLRRWNAVGNGRSIHDHYRTVLDLGSAQRGAFLA